MGDAGARPGQRSGGCGVIRPRNGRTHGHTHVHAAFFTRGAHLAKAAAAGAGEDAGGGDGSCDDARDVGRRSDAADGRRDARRGACEHGSTLNSQKAASIVGQKGPKFELSRRLRTL